MSHQQTSYAKRLPYGYGFDPEARIEAIFDRTYHTIATRSVDAPYAPNIHGKRPGFHVDSMIGGFFYKDADRLRSLKSTDARREMVLSRFLLGIDVRRFIQEENQRDLLGIPEPNFVPLQGDDEGRLSHMSGPFPRRNA